MKTLVLLAQHFGEFCYTSKTPVKEFNPETDTKLLTEMISTIMNNDNWMEVKVNKYEVINVTVPDWCDANYYINYEIQLKYYFGFGANIDWPKAWFEKINKLSCSKLKFACIKLLSSNLRSEFRKSLKVQLENWLNVEVNKYDTPFSPKQTSILLDKYTTREHDCLSEKLYWSR